MRFLVDANLPKALAALLIARGHEAEHVLDIEAAQAADAALWALAKSRSGAGDRLIEVR